MHQGSTCIISFIIFTQSMGRGTAERPAAKHLLLVGREYGSCQRYCVCECSCSY